MMLRTLKNFTPFPVRIFLKERLPSQLVGTVTTKPIPSHKQAEPVRGTAAPNATHRPVKAECPICGTALAPASRKKEIRCTGCGSTSNQRRLALAFYACAERDQRILVLGSDPILQSLCNETKNAHWASDLAHVPSEWRTHVHLCIHSPGTQARALPPEKLLRGANAFLSPNGKQIFTPEGFAVSWRIFKWQLRTTYLVRWLQQKGWPEVSEFEPDDHYGAGSSEVFACKATGSLADAVIMLPKISANTDAAQ